MDFHVISDSSCDISLEQEKAGVFSGRSVPAPASKKNPGCCASWIANLMWI